MKAMLIATFAVGLVLMPFVTRAQSRPSLDWFLVDGIVGDSGNGHTSFIGTISYEDTGFMANGSLSFYSVFQVRPFPSGLDSPLLQISLTTNHVLIRWPSRYAAYQLECAPTLQSGDTNWTTVAQPPVTEGAELHLALPANAPARFYRLRLE